MALWGSDFTFQNASSWFGNMSLVVDAINRNSSRSGVTIRFATANEYFDALHQEPPPLETAPLENEFEPLAASSDGSYMTGAVASRSQLKAAVRKVGSKLRMAEVLHAVSPLAAAPGDAARRVLLEANRAVGLLQHHDALPGTMTSSMQMDSKDCLYSADCHCRDASCEVLEDYLYRLGNASDGLKNLTVAATAAIAHATAAGTGQIRADGSDNRTWIAVSNPLGHDRTEMVDVVASDLPAEWRGNLSALTVLDAANKPVLAQVAWQEPLFYFEATVPALGVAVFSVTADISTAGKYTIPSSLAPNGTSWIESSGLRLDLDLSKGAAAHVTHKASGLSSKLIHELRQYEDTAGDSYRMIQRSPSRDLFNASGWLAAPVVERGPLYQQVVSYNYCNEGDDCPRGLHTRVRVQRTQPDVIDWIHEWSSVPLDTQLSIRLTTDLRTGGAFHADESGFEMRRFEHNASKPIAGNYRSIVQTASIADEDAALAVLSESTWGLASLGTGQLELLIQRRLSNRTHDDAGNPLTHMGPFPLDDDLTALPYSAITSMHGSGGNAPLRAVFGPPDAVEQVRTMRALEHEFPLASTQISGKPARTHLAPLVPGALAEGVHVLSFAARLASNGSTGNTKPQWVLRLQNVLQNSPAIVVGDIAKLFNPQVLRVASCVETTLTLQQHRSANHRYAWWPEDGPNGQKHEECTKVSLTPKDIRTFVLEFHESARAAYKSDDSSRLARNWLPSRALLANYTANTSCQGMPHWSLTVTYADANEKILPLDQPPTDLVSTGIRLRAARGERQDFQLVLQACQGLQKLNIVPHQFDSTGGANFGWEVRQVAFTHVDVARNRDNRTGLFPDPLPPLSASLSAGDSPSYVPAYLNTPFWLTVSTPADAKPGVHRTTVDVMVGSDVPGPAGISGVLCRLAVHLTVLDFAIPTGANATMTTDAQISYLPTDMPVAPGDRWIDVYKQWLRNLAEHRVNQQLFGQHPLLGLQSGCLEGGTGPLATGATASVRNATEYLDLAHFMTDELGMRRIQFPPTCDREALGIETCFQHSGPTSPHRRHTFGTASNWTFSFCNGSSLSVPVFDQRAPGALPTLQPDFVRLFNASVGATAVFFKAQGLLDRTLVMVADEAYGSAKEHPFTHQGLKLLSNLYLALGAPGVVETGSPALFGAALQPLISQWVIAISEFTESQAKLVRAANQTPLAYHNDIPIVDMPGLRVRSFFWQLWLTNWNASTGQLQGGLQGSLSWFCINRWEGIRPYETTNPLTAGGFHRPAGIGALVYPPHPSSESSQPVSSIRWEMMRKGLEDVEAFQLLATKLAEVEKLHGIGRDCELSQRQLHAGCCEAVVAGHAALNALDTLIWRFPQNLRTVFGPASQLPIAGQDEPYTHDSTLVHERLDAVADALVSTQQCKTDDRELTVLEPGQCQGANRLRLALDQSAWCFQRGSQGWALGSLSLRGQPLEAAWTDGLVIARQKQKSTHPSTVWLPAATGTKHSDTAATFAGTAALPSGTLSFAVSVQLLGGSPSSSATTRVVFNTSWEYNASDGADWFIGLPFMGDNMAHGWRSQIYPWAGNSSRLLYHGTPLQYNGVPAVTVFRPDWSLALLHSLDIAEDVQVRPSPKTPDAPQQADRSSTVTFLRTLRGGRAKRGTTSTPAARARAGCWKSVATRRGAPPSSSSRPTRAACHKR